MGPRQLWLLVRAAGATLRAPVQAGCARGERSETGDGENGVYVIRLQQTRRQEVVPPQTGPFRALADPSAAEALDDPGAHRLVGVALLRLRGPPVWVRLVGAPLGPAALLLGLALLQLQVLVFGGRRVCASWWYQALVGGSL